MSITLRQPLTLDEVQRVREWRNDPSVLPMLRTGFKTEAEQEAFYRDVIAPSWWRRFVRWVRREPTHWYFAVMDEWRFVGMGGLTYVSGHTAEISLILGPEYRRQGYGSSAVKALLAESFYRRHLGIVRGECYAQSPARAFWERCISQPGLWYIAARCEHENGTLTWAWTPPGPDCGWSRS